MTPDQDVLMRWAGADRTMPPSDLVHDAVQEMAEYAAAYDLVLVSAPELRWTDAGLTGRAHARVDQLAADVPIPACAVNAEPDLWRSKASADRVRAVGICTRECRVIDACLTGALYRGEDYGIWGGHDMAAVAKKRVVA